MLLIKNAVAQLTQEEQDRYADFQKKLENALQNKESEQKLHVEYAHLFLLPEGVKPYESVYRSNDKIMHQQPWQDVKKFYASHGFVLDQDEIHPEDHVSVEFSFMAGLLEQHEGEALLFFKTHLQTWIPDFLEDMINNPYADFYKEVAQCGLRLMQQESK